MAREDLKCLSKDCCPFAKSCHHLPQGTEGPRSPEPMLAAPQDGQEARSPALGTKCPPAGRGLWSRACLWGPSATMGHYVLPPPSSFPTKVTPDCGTCRFS